MTTIATILITAIVSFIAGIIAERLTERRTLVRSIADRYIELAQQTKTKSVPTLRAQGVREPVGDDDDEFWRIGTLQDLGAGELSEFELNSVCDRIALRGLKDPRNREIYVFDDDRRNLFNLLRWAAKHSISLHDGGNLLRIRAEEMDTENARNESA
jgi:hypothetical protein